MNLSVTSIWYITITTLFVPYKGRLFMSFFWTQGVPKSHTRLMVLRVIAVCVPTITYRVLTYSQWCPTRVFNVGSFHTSA